MATFGPVACLLFRLVAKDGGSDCPRGDAEVPICVGGKMRLQI